jgi:hypothetical protein
MKHPYEPNGVITIADNLRLRAEVDQLRRERDEARRRVCHEMLKRGVLFYRQGATSVAVTKVSEVAKMMDWDCFKEETA